MPAVQPGGEELAPWAETARADRSRSAGVRAARWGLMPPANIQLRGQALAAADEILRTDSPDDAADQLHPWTELTPATNDGQLGWLADHTTMTPLLTRLVMAATSSRRRLATLLDSSASSMISNTTCPKFVPKRAVGPLARRCATCGAHQLEHGSAGDPGAMV